MEKAASSPSLIERFTVPLHPPLVAAFFVLFLFAENAEQLVVLNPLWGPLAAAVVGGMAALCLCWIALRNWLRAGLLATCFLVLFFTFGHVWLAVARTGADRIWLVAVWMVLAVAGILIAARAGGWIRPTTRFLNLVAAMVVLVNAVSVAGYAVADPGSASEEDRTVPLGSTSYRPDIYYIVLDRYANGATLDRVYGYDNSPFLDAMRDRGFSVADDAWANHYKTGMSLSSSLNMDYLQAEHPPTEHPAPWRWIPSVLRGHRAVPDTLTTNGYEYVHIGNWWEPSAINVAADVVLRRQSYGAFAAALYETSALSLSQPPLTGDDDPETLDFPALARSQTLFAFDEVAKAASRPGPTYVFAHILVPHPPYVFNADGSFPTRDDVTERGRLVSYVEQVEYANTRILQLVDTLLGVPAADRPVIVLMADEGPYPERYARDEQRFPWLEATDLEVEQKFGILNALYLPGGLDPADYGFGPRTSPVNEFRIVFNALFDARLDLLPDLTYLSPDHAHLYDFVLYPR
jgi:hypothetical protein